MTPPPPTLPAPFWRVNAEHESRPALRDRHQHLTYAELDAAVDACARELPTAPELVAIAAHNTIPTVVAYLACLRAGHAATLVDPAQASTYRTAPGSAARLLLGFDPRPGQPLPSVGARPNATPTAVHPDLALVVPTSGSTGSPRAVRLSRSNVTANAADIADALGLADDDVALANLPLHYCYGLSVVTSHLHVGASVALTDLSVSDPDLWAFAADVGVTSFAGVPYTFELIDRVGPEHLALPTLRRVTQAGGRLAPASVDDYTAQGARQGWDFVVMYGQTEATARMTVLPPDRRAGRADVVGFPLPGSDVRLAPVADQPDGVGELVFTGPGVMMGYAEQAEDYVRPAETPELHTGDLARLHPDGCVQIVGRLAGFAKVAGRRLDTAALTAALRDNGRTAAVVGGADRLHVVVEGTETDAQDVAAHLAQRCAIPRDAVYAAPVDAVPRGSAGKVDACAVRLLADSPCRPGGGATTADAKIAAALRFHTRTPDVGPGDSFVTVGGDSLAYVALSVELEAIVGCLPAGWERLTVAQLASYGDGRPTATGHPLRRVWRPRSVDTSIVLRAVAMIMIVVTHSGLAHLAGGAHPLLAVAGFNVARFGLRSVPPQGRLRRVAAMLGRLVATTWPLLLVFYLARDYYERDILTYTYRFGPFGEWTPSMRFWFIDALVWSCLIVAVTVAVPRVARLGHRGMFWLWTGAAVGGLLFRFGVIGQAGAPGADTALATVWWYFAVGVALGFASTWHDRVLLSALAVIPTVGFFDDPVRIAVVAAGVLVLVWAPSLQVPSCVVPALRAIAGASLFIYVVHWEVLLPLKDRGLSLVGVVASLAVGVACKSVVDHVGAALSRARATAPDAPDVAATRT